MRRSLAGQPEIGFVDECGSLQGVTGPLTSHVAMGDPAQFTVDEGNSLIKGGMIAWAPPREQFSDLRRRLGGHHPPPLQR